MELEIKSAVEQMAKTVAQIEQDAKSSGVDAKNAIELANELKTRLEGANFANMDEVKAFAKTIQDEFQKQLDEVAAVHKAPAKTESKGLFEAIQEKVADMYSPINGSREMKSELFDKMRNRHDVVNIDLGIKNFTMKDLFELKDMTLGNALTGDPVASYSNRQAILPTQKINIRDLCRTINTPTGFYVFYSETATTNNIYTQNEGSVKGENNYDLVENKIVQKYVAGFSTFSKQFVNSFPFVTQTLPAMLMRDFFKAENSLFYNTIIQTAGTGATTGQTDVVKKFVEFAAYQRKQNFNTSFAIVDPNVYAALVNSTYTNGYYPGAGGLMWNGTSLTISGVPIIEASWANTTTVLFIDSDYLERVQVSGLNIALSYESDQNFKNNLVTARIECQEEINLMLGASALYETLVA